MIIIIMKIRGVFDMNKTISFAITHFVVAFSVAWLLTGDLLVGGLVALVEPAVNTLAYHIHEKAWLNLSKRKEDGDNLGLIA
jgi:uncharacterized membrane protein